jgi:hypothetical protein
MPIQSARCPFMPQIALMCRALYNRSRMEQPLVAVTFFAEDHSAPVGAAVNSQGRKPLESGETTPKPRRGDTLFDEKFRPSRALADFHCRSEGLAPLAINFRPFRG